MLGVCFIMIVFCNRSLLSITDCRVFLHQVSTSVCVFCAVHRCYSSVPSASSCHLDFFSFLTRCQVIGALFMILPQCSPAFTLYRLLPLTCSSQWVYTVILLCSFSSVFLSSLILPHFLAGYITPGSADGKTFLPESRDFPHMEEILPAGHLYY